jgi:small subunit ribosomal protein S6
LAAPTYDLVLMLDPQAEEATRAKIIADTRAAIEAQGELVRYDEWGARALTYPIDRKAVAEYHLLQFHSGAPELLGSLERTLRITDGIIRFRIIKLKPGVPDAPDVAGPPAAERRTEAEAPVEDVAETEGAAETALPETEGAAETALPETEIDAEVGEPA